MKGISGNVVGLCVGLSVAAFCAPAQQGTDRMSEFFEGRTVVLKLDMPGTQQGVDVNPQKGQPLDMKSYSNRIKQCGVALRNGDSAMVTKVKVKDDNIEFQLAGGGYGTAGDDTDTSVHFTSSEKSGREKDLESRIKSEQNPDRRRGLQHELDEARGYRERRDRQDREMAEQAAEAKKQVVMAKRLQGGSRFNLRLDVKNSGGSITPQMVMTMLAAYVTFPPEAFGGSTGPRLSEAVRSEAVRNDATPPNGAMSGLHKGLTREQVEAMFGPPSETRESNQNGLAVVSCTYKANDSTVTAAFVNGVLVQYTVASR